MMIHSPFVFGAPAPDEAGERPITAADLAAYQSATSRCNGTCETEMGCDCIAVPASVYLQGKSALRDFGRGNIVWRDSAPAFVSTVPVLPADACTDIGADPQGQHRAGWFTRAWLRFARALG